MSIVAGCNARSGGWSRAAHAWCHWKWGAPFGPKHRPPPPGGGGLPGLQGRRLDVNQCKQAAPNDEASAACENGACPEPAVTTTTTGVPVRVTSTTLGKCNCCSATKLEFTAGTPQIGLGRCGSV